MMGCKLCKRLLYDPVFHRCDASVSPALVTRFLEVTFRKCTLSEQGCLCIGGYCSVVTLGVAHIHIYLAICLKTSIANVSNHNSCYHIIELALTFKATLQPYLWSWMTRLNERFCPSSTWVGLMAQPRRDGIVSNWELVGFRQLLEFNIYI